MLMREGAQSTCLTIGTLKEHPHRRQGIDSGTLNVVRTLTSQFRPQLINEKDQHVLFLGRLRHKKGAQKKRGSEGSQDSSGQGAKSFHADWAKHSFISILPLQPIKMLSMAAPSSRNKKSPLRFHEAGLELIDRSSSAKERSDEQRSSHRLRGLPGCKYRFGRRRPRIHQQ